MNFTTAEQVQSTIRQGDYVARVQSDNRTKTNNLFNGFPPLSPEEAKRSNVRLNVNWGEAARIAQHGIRQYLKAFLGPKNFFRITLPDAPVEKAIGWEIFMTRSINRIMKKSRKYMHVHKYKWNSVLLHGLGPTLWYDDEKWCPDYISLPNWRVPTDSWTDFENLNWFATREPYTVYSLAKKVWGKNADPHWQAKPVSAMLANKIDINYDNSQAYNWLNNPEHMAELVKQNGMYYQSDAVPIIPLWHFYYLDDSDLDNKVWKMTVVPDVLGGATATQPDEFLYVNEKPVRNDLSQLLHCQTGDLNVDPPFKIHSVRGLGFMLMEPCFYSNLTRCRFLQHVHESFNVWLRVTDPQGKARAQKMELYDRAIIPEGVSIVPQDQRHQIRPELVEGAMQELRQLQAESATAYTQDIHEPGDERETATKTLSKEQVANQLLGGLLADAFGQEKSSYEEICRRFCIRKTTDKECQQFQDECIEFGIPREFINASRWEVEPEVPLGNGNQSVAMASAQQLMNIRPMLNPTAQQEALHEFVEVITDDPRKADRMAPLEDNQGITNAVERAESIFGTLMQGVPARLKDGLNPIEVIETLLGMMAGVVTRIEQNGNMATAGEVAGLQITGQYVAQLVQQLEQNPQEKQRVKQYTDSLGKLTNSVKGFAQRLAEQGDAARESLSINYKDVPPSIRRQMEAKAGFQPATETEAQVDPKTQKAVHSMAVKDAGAQQKQAHQQQAFDQEQARKDFETTAQIQRDHVAAAAEIEREKIKTEAEVERQKKVAAAAPKEPATASAG